MARDRPLLLCSGLFLFGVLRRSERVLWVGIAAEGVALGTAALVHRSLPAGILGLLVSAMFGTVALRALTEPAARKTLRRAAVPMGVMLVTSFYLRFKQFPVPHPIEAPTWLVIVGSWVLGYGLFFGLFALRRRQFPPPLLWLGRISYSFYLFHVLVFLAVPPLRSAWGTLLVDLLVTALVADVSFRLVERPALLLQRRLWPMPRG